MGPKFLEHFKKGQNKNHISKLALGFPIFFQIRTSSHNNQCPVNFSLFLFRNPENALGLFAERNNERGKRIGLFSSRFLL